MPQIKRSSSRRPGPAACLVFTRSAPPSVVTAAVFRAGFTLVERQFSRSFDEMLRELDPDLVILALAASDNDDLAVLRYVSAQADGTPVLALVEEDREECLVAAMDAGATAALPMTAATDLIAAQVMALHRLMSAHEPAGKTQTLVRIADLVLDQGRRTISRGGERIALTRTEFDILALLAENSGRVLTTTEIVAGIGQLTATKAQARGIVKVHVSHVRQKLGTGPQGEYVATIRGVGYLVDAEPVASEASGPREPGDPQRIFA